MERMRLFKKILSVMLVISMLAAYVVPANAASNRDVSIRKIDNSAVTASMLSNKKAPVEKDAKFEDSDVVRVSIVLEKKSTVSAGFELENIGTNNAAMAYRDTVEKEQNTVTAKIQKAIGKKLDVVWNLTLAANIISANVNYGEIAEIEKVPGVAKVLIENVYYPDVVSIGGTKDPMMATSSKQIGSSVAWNAGYTGAGTRVAIIDTGLDCHHISFDSAAFDFALGKIAEQKNMEAEAYIASLDLLDKAEIAAVAEQLNTKVSSEDAYKGTKIPFGVDYVQKNGDVSHTNLPFDGAEHGSHVAGISAANTYVPAGNGEFKDALSTVAVRGVAPEAQLIVMKVFRNTGGTYESDYMAAIEDAIVLGADAINLSLGSNNPGFGTAEKEYQHIMDGLENAGAVVCISAGNAGTWAENAPYGHLYSDDVSMYTGGSPGSFKNSLCVASVDNDGTLGSFVKVGDQIVIYSETSYSNKPLSTLAGENEYVFLQSCGTEADFAAVGDAVKGKIVLCSRGEITFVEKAENAAKAGASAVIIYNNEPGVINMDLTAYTKEMPAVTITLDGANEIAAASEPVTDSEGNVLYRKGIMSVSRGNEIAQKNSDYYTMSEFSSWGIPGTLEMKPEITAPGGNIYSVWGTNPNGGGIDQYEQMSGTSMSSPQVAGMSALVAQYIHENKLDKKTGMSARHLAQSLLMSTAEPMRYLDSTQTETYYPVLQQGAGLANVGLAVSAESYITMDQNATASWSDGKVKFEFGDDPERTGNYEFTFTIHNLTSDAETYALSGDFFIQSPIPLDLDEDGNADLIFMDKGTSMFGPDDVSITWSAADPSAVTVPADGTVNVTARIKLSEDIKKVLNTYYPNGTYIQGYVYAESTASAEGAAGTCHSIPCLGFYGSWTDPSMFDVGSYNDPGTVDSYTGNDITNVFLMQYADHPHDAYYFGGNPVLPDKEYMPERNAINAAKGDMINEVDFTMIRNAASSKFEIVDKNTGATLGFADGEPQYSAYYSPSSGSWENANGFMQVALELDPAIPEGHTLEFSFLAAPEYYLNEFGAVEWDRVKDGAKLSVTATVDNTAPVVATSEIQLDKEKRVLHVPVSDNQYVAGVALVTADGSQILSTSTSKENVNAGDKATFDIDLSGVMGSKFIIQVIDYAANIGTYEVTVNLDDITPLPDMLAYDANGEFWVNFNKDTAPYDDPEGTESTHLDCYVTSNLDVLSATIAENVLYTACADGMLYANPVKHPFDAKCVGRLDHYVIDMAYNSQDGLLYALTADNEILSIDRFNANIDLVGEMPFAALTLACDKNGTFYTNEVSTGNVYSFKVEDIPPIRYSSVQNNRFIDLKIEKISELPADLNKLSGGGKYIHAVDVPGENAANNFELVVEGITGNSGPLYSKEVIQAMEINPNNGKLCWTSTMQDDNAEVFSYYIEIDPATGTYEIFNDMVDLLYALAIPCTDDEDKLPPVTEIVSGVQLDLERISLFKGGTTELTAIVQPWTTENNNVVWTSADESIAVVDEEGKVSTLKAGKTTVTATSVVNPEISAKCEVIVENINYSVHGVLQNDKGKPYFYDWDLSKEVGWQIGKPIEAEIVSATYDQKHNQTIALNGSMVYRIDADGNTIESAKNSSVPMWDIACSSVDDSISAVYGPYLFVNQDPMKLNFNAYNLSDVCTKYFTGITSLGTETLVDESTGEELVGDHIVLIDAGGTILHLVNFGEAGILPYSMANSDLELSFDGYDDGNMFCSLSADDFGNLYLSYFNGSTNEIYYLVYDQETNTYSSTRLCDFGDGIWPAVITNVTDNIEWNAPEFYFAEDGKSAEAVFISKNPAGQTRVVDAIVDHEIKVPATCEKTGVSTYVASVYFAGKYYTATVDKDDIPALGHEYGEPVFEFAEDYKTATATFTCVHDSSHTVTVKDEKVESEVKSAATCDKAGITTYTASVEFNGETYTEHKDVETHPALGHDYGEPEITFAEDGQTATAKVTCKREGCNHVQMLKPTVSSEVKADVTCEQDGLTVYTATVEFAGKTYTATKNVTHPAPGHDWSEWKVVKEPTFEKEGLKERTCSRCHETEQKPIPKKFKDVKDNTFYSEPVMWAVVNEITNGNSDGSFAPDGQCTRGQVVTFLWRAAGRPAPTITKCDFKDVLDDDYFKDAVLWAVENGITKGVEADRFGWNETCTRAQTVTLLWRAAGKPAPKTEKNPFHDVGNNEYYTDAILWASENKITNGIAPDTFAPEDVCNRSQVVTLLYRDFINSKEN